MMSQKSQENFVISASRVNKVKYVFGDVNNNNHDDDEDSTNNGDHDDIGAGGR